MAQARPTPLALVHAQVDGLILAIFAASPSAVEWALLLQLSLAQATWPQLLVGNEGGRCSSEQGRLPASPFRVSARVGIFHGEMDRVVPHGKTGRADVLGPPANRAARLMSAASPGQVARVLTPLGEDADIRRNKWPCLRPCLLAAAWCSIPILKVTGACTLVL